MKVAIITDQHFGFKKGSKIWLDYFQKFYDEVFFPTLKKEGIDTILDLGDTFDNRKGVDLRSLDWAKSNYFDIIRDNGMKMISIVGNHTAFYKDTNDINTIDLMLREYDNIRIVEECEEITVGGLPILFIPWINSENDAKTYQMIQQSTCNVAMGHLELNGFVATHGHVMDVGADFECYNKFKHVFSGHYHTRSNNGSIYYLGNPYEMFWNDVNDKRGFHIDYTDPLQLKTINNPNAMYKILDYANTPRQMTNFEQYRNKIVKVVVREKDDDKAYDMFMQSLSKASPYDIKVVERTVNMLAPDEDIAQSEDTMTLLNTYIDDLSTDLNKSKIKDILRETYQQACEVL